MRQMMPVRVSLLAALLLAAQWCAALSCERPLSMGWEPWPPHQYRTADGRVTGSDVEMVRLALERIGCTMTTVGLPWTRLQEEMQAGRVDLAAGLQWTEERATWGRYSRPYSIDRNVVFVRIEDAEAFRGVTLDRLAEGPWRVGVTRDFEYGPAFREALRTTGLRSRLFEAWSDPQLLDHLIQRRIDLFLAVEMVGRHLVANSAHAGRIVPADAPPLAETPSHVVASRVSVGAATMAALDAALQDLVADGTVARLIEDHSRRLVPLSASGRRDLERRDPER